MGINVSSEYGGLKLDVLAYDIAMEKSVDVAQGLSNYVNIQ